MVPFAVLAFEFNVTAAPSVTALLKVCGPLVVTLPPNVVVPVTVRLVSGVVPTAPPNITAPVLPAFTVSASAPSTVLTKWIVPFPVSLRLAAACRTTGLLYVWPPPAVVTTAVVA